MKIVQQQTVGDVDVLELVQSQVPTPAAGELLVRIAATSVNPVDTAVRAGAFPLLGAPPFVLGWDLAGTVEQVGDGVENWSVGDRVFGMPLFPQQAATNAEYAVVPAAEVATVPDGMSDEQAAALPLVGLTAWQALVHTAKLQAGQRVLIHAAGGGVGHVAVQIAKALGAYVIATASESKIGFVRSLGADEVIDYRAQRFEDVVAPVDVVLDPLVGDITPRSASVLVDGGIITSLLDPDPGVVDQLIAAGKRFERIGVSPSAADLTSLAELVTAGTLSVTVSATFSLDEIAAAHTAVETGSTLGKVVVTI
ncbi:NADP-dependent oxidoreductase [Rhodococcoides yunnanense]|uniref:NADP-dependent oxidoreductase n=1 Tax=Rhodococcoides yunnanense TaxID=278209 RepID=A0ABU4BK72_9NOCA|nr:NADP-dependent oxidoreductase [Rhodococcus yunnanensis]MDV6264628.1 NADP-dependent oxidoreductase [Rhodococcus yunnanensis]